MTEPEYHDIFLKGERFVFICGGPVGCGATVMREGMELHTEWHEQRNEIWNTWNGESH